MTSNPSPVHGERADLTALLRTHRALFRGALTGVSDEQAAATPTVSALCLGGLLKHVTAAEAQWAGFVTDGPWRIPDIDFARVDSSDPPPEVRVYRDGFRMVEGETMACLLAGYDEVAAATDALAATVDLDAVQALPAAPWFEPGAAWSNRRVFGHILAETAQHAGHADIIRETLDGARSTG